MSSNKDLEIRRRYANAYRLAQTKRRNAMGLNSHGKPKKIVVRSDKSDAELDKIAAEWLSRQDMEMQ